MRRLLRVAVAYMIMQALWTLDGGGGANAENARLAISVSAADPDVKVIFV